MHCTYMTKKRKSEWERFQEPLGIDEMYKSMVLYRDGGSTYDAGHKQVN